MGATNFTSHYELPQFVASDKPSWLGDINSAFLKIDSGMSANKAASESANSAATAAQTQVANVSSQLSAVEGKANIAVDSATIADGKATSAQQLAQKAVTTASEAKAVAESAVPLAGGTMTGALLLSGSPNESLQAATKQYVDESVADIQSGVRVYKFGSFDASNPTTLGATNLGSFELKSTDTFIEMDIIGGYVDSGGTGSASAAFLRLVSGDTIDISNANIISSLNSASFNPQKIIIGIGSGHTMFLQQNTTALTFSDKFAQLEAGTVAIKRGQSTGTTVVTALIVRVG